MRHLDRFLLLFLLPLALAAPARQDQDKAPQAGADKDPYAERFEQLDRDRDGHVSLPEWPLDPASFERVDRNRDGRLSRSELLSPNGLPVDPMEDQFRELDANRDGCVSWNEWQRGRYGVQRPDRNEAGTLTRREPGRAPRNPDDAWSSRATLQDQRRFQDLDRNRDNRLSRIEWNGSRASFNRLDRNRDGVLSPSEWLR